ncbi:MAG: DUF4142 domain-containing protein [Proteobacteria bacterium]|nr:DUF4142 domain-containing protein [Pseudomonadota bacterium]
MRLPVILIAALSVSGVACAARAQADASPRGFIENAIRGDNSEMMLGKLAANRATDPKVRDYGRTLYQDHARAKDKAVAVAHQIGADVTDRSNAGAVAERDKLQTIYGRAFDREFVRYMVADHHQDIADFREEAQHGGPAGRLAADTLPDLQKHLDIAERLSSE